jgi:hypothetical protein
MKCQRCRLKKTLFLNPTEPFSATSLNLTLNFEHSLTHLSGASKMDDIFAVELFSVDNLVALCRTNESEISASEIEYMTPFVLWYAAVAIGDLTRKVRLSLLEIAFRVLAKWYAIWFNLPATKITDTTSWTRGLIHFAVEGIDAIRYMNSVIFLYIMIEPADDVALDWIGTHSAENYFGTTRLNSNYGHSWDRSTSAAAKGILSAEILPLTNSSCPVGEMSQSQV